MDKPHNIVSFLEEQRKRGVSLASKYLKPGVKPAQKILEDLRKGSIKGWFKNVLEKIPDEGLKDLNWKKVVGHYLVKGKYLIIKFEFVFNE